MDRLKAILALFLFATPVAAQQCGTLSTCPTVNLPLAGSEFFYVVQGNTSKKITAAQMGVIGSGGTVTSVSVVTAHGVSGTVATPTQTPAITLTLGAITPSSVAIGAGSAITSSGAGGALGTAAFTAASAYLTTAGAGTGVATAYALPVNTTGGFATVSGAWTAYTPVATCTTGSVTSFTTLAGRYQAIGKTIFLQINANIATAGSCSGTLFLSLPTAAPTVGAGVIYPLAVANASSNVTPAITVAAFSSSVAMVFGGAPTANNYFVNGTYEAN